MYETPSFEDLFIVFSGKPARRLIYIVSGACVVLRDAVFKSLNEPLPSGKLSQGSDPVLRCWWPGSQRLSFYGTPQPLCFPVMRRVKLKRVILEEFSQHNFKERREVHGRIEDSGATCGTTVVGCHLVDTDIVDFSDLGHDSTLRITCGITVMTWYCDIRLNNTDIYDFDLMTLLVIIYKKQCDKHCADKIKEDYDETDFLLLFYPRKSLKGTCLCSYETHLF